MSDIGAIELGWWHDWHLSWKIGATSFVKVGCLGASAANAGTAMANTALAASNPCGRRRFKPVMSFLLGAPGVVLASLFVTPTTRATQTQLHTTAAGASPHAVDVYQNPDTLLSGLNLQVLHDPLIGGTSSVMSF
jgi:hypothetical protein